MFTICTWYHSSATSDLCWSNFIILSQAANYSLKFQGVLTTSISHSQVISKLSVITNKFPSMSHTSTTIKVCKQWEYSAQSWKLLSVVKLFLVKCFIICSVNSYILVPAYKLKCTWKILYKKYNTCAIVLQ